MPVPTKWVELHRLPARSRVPDIAVALFVNEFWRGGRAWDWADEPAGIFTVPGALSIYRARLTDDGFWVFEFACRY